MILEHSSADTPVVQHQIPCRICAQVGLNSVLLRDAEAESGESTWPIDLAWCPTCSLVQWTETIIGAPTTQSVSVGRIEKSTGRSLGERLCEWRKLGPDSLVIELDHRHRELAAACEQAGVPMLSIDLTRCPSHGAEIKPADRPIHEIFGPDLALHLVHENQRADVIHAGQTFSYVEDLNGVVSGFATVLKPEGIVVVEVPYLKDLADHVGFNTLDRSELCYFSLTSMTQLFGQHGLEIVDVEHLKTQGGVLRIIAARSGTMSVSPAVHHLMDDESAWVRDPSFYQSFGDTLAPLSDDRWAA